MSNQDQPKVFDIMRPGKAPAAPTSRPVIVGHKPEVRDSLIGGDTAKFSDQNAKRPLLNALAKVTLQPSTQPSADVPSTQMPFQPAEPELPEPTSIEPSARPIQPEPPASPAPAEMSGPLQQATAVDITDAAISPQPEPPAPAAPTAEPTSDPIETDATPAAKPPLPDASTQQLLKDAAAAQEAEQSHPLLQNGNQVYVSHHKHQWRWWEVILLLLAMLFLAAIALNFLLDADVITTNLNVPHTNFL